MAWYNAIAPATCESFLVTFGPSLSLRLEAVEDDGFNLVQVGLRHGRLAGRTCRHGSLRPFKIGRHLGTTGLLPVYYRIGIRITGKSRVYVSRYDRG
jgi:hypothetical protein